MMGQRIVRYGLGVAIATQALLATTAVALEPSQLTVTIEGLSSGEGQVCLNLFDRRDGFPSDRTAARATECVDLTSLDLTTTPVSVTFAALPPGSYAVSAYHDANSDNVLNRNGFGMPIEGFGFSQNPAVQTRAPEFGDAVVIVAGTNTTIQIQMQYL